MLIEIQNGGLQQNGGLYLTKWQFFTPFFQVLDRPYNDLDGEY